MFAWLFTCNMSLHGCVHVPCLHDYLHAAYFHILHVSHEILFHAKQHFIQNMKFYENYYYSLTWKFTPCKMTFYMKFMTASCSMSNFLPIVIIFRQITYLV